MKTYAGKGVPKLLEGQYSLIQAETWTGKILTLDGRRYDSQNHTDYILVFDSLDEAETYARNRAEEAPDVECHIHDHNGEFVKTIVKEGHTRTKHSHPYRSPWWKFWLWRFK